MKEIKQEIVKMAIYLSNNLCSLVICGGNQLNSQFQSIFVVVCPIEALKTGCQMKSKLRCCFCLFGY